VNKYKIKIQRYDEFCDLCSEYHEYINCPLCNGEVNWIYEGEIACCSNNHRFAVWSRDKEIVIVECEHIFEMKYAQAQCGEDSKWELIAQGSEVDLQCCEEECPLLAPSLSHFRQSIMSSSITTR